MVQGFGDPVGSVRTQRVRQGLAPAREDRLRQAFEDRRILRRWIGRMESEADDGRLHFRRGAEGTRGEGEKTPNICSMPNPLACSVAPTPRLSKVIAR